ncbi:hypothetical protein [Actinokineospora sp. HUAS TT18]|uniref:hypothetical protein n=1 Tax=Actinokineospora sp. HUAS TT18 TaxID=3447451 RepID=UPI003F51F0AC
MIKIYHPWPVPVEAVCYSVPESLTEMAVWVNALRARGLVGPDVGFEIRWTEPLTGVLTDGGRSREVAPSAFLVFSRNGLEVVDRMAFLRSYREP